MIIEVNDADIAKMREAEKMIREVAAANANVRDRINAVADRVKAETDITIERRDAFRMGV